MKEGANYPARDVQCSLAKLLNWTLETGTGRITFLLLLDEHVSNQTWSCKYLVWHQQLPPYDVHRSEEYRGETVSQPIASSFRFLRHELRNRLQRLSVHDVKNSDRGLETAPYPIPQLDRHQRVDAIV
jgi:hypothetical protein